MGLTQYISGLFGANKQKIVGTSPIPLVDSSIKFFEYGGTVQWQNANNPTIIADMILSCPPLAYILNRKALAFVNGKTRVYNASTDNYVQGKYRAWEKLLAKPNPLQTDTQFRVELYTYIQAFGYCVVMKDIPFGFDGTSVPSAIWVLPPNFCNIQMKQNVNYFASKSWIDLVEYIEFTYAGTTTKLDKSKLYIFTDVTTNMDSVAFPDSKLIPLKYPINNLIKSYEARGVIAERRGAVGMLSNERADNISALPMTQKEIQATQDSYRKYGMSKDQWQLFITNIPMRYQQMAMPVKDMMLLEMEEADVRTICNAFGYPYHLLSNEEGTTFSNMEKADSSLYQNTIIPECRHFEYQMNDLLYAPQNNIRIEYDYDWLPVMQGDDKLRAETRKRLGEALLNEFNYNLITWNQVRLGLGYDSISGFDKFKYELTEIYGNDFQTPASPSGGVANSQ
jgi:hypothetical protein